MSFFRKIFSLPLRAIQRTRIYRFFTYEPDQVPIGDVVQTALDNPVELLPHLNDLRVRIMWILIYFAIGSMVSFFFVTPIMQILARPLPGGLDSLRGVDVTEPVGAVMWVVVLSGFIISFPFIVWQVWLFFVAGLSGRERLWTMMAIPAAILFFAGGVAFTYYVLLPQALPFLTNFMELQTIPRPITYFPFVVNLMLWIGLSFEFPMIAMVLGRIGVFHSSDLLRFWRYAVVIIALFAAAITTTIDPANMLLAMVPMIFLYFLSIGLMKLVEKPKG
jgi:sec-independent protein translocase protein TatC